MRFSQLLILSCTLLFFISCKTNQLEGLWVIDEVRVGTETMTPDARWVRFQKDQTQRSGNGWLQHSVGTWNYNPKLKSLQITNSNGYLDEGEPFLVDFNKNQMTWTREEQGQLVTVELARADLLPQAAGDKILGVWDLQKATQEGRDITDSFDPESKRYLFIRWDKAFVSQHTPNGRQSGIYRVHAHRPEVEFIYDGGEANRQRWQFTVKPESLTLKSADQKLVLEYKRIHHFPE